METKVWTGSVSCMIHLKDRSLVHYSEIQLIIANIYFKFSFYSFGYIEVTILSGPPQKQALKG